MKKNRYTMTFSRHSFATITVTAADDEEAQQLAVENLEKLHPEASKEEDVEIEFVDLKEVEPDGPDREEE